MKNRRTFLKTACKSIVLAAFGIPILEACSTEETPESSTSSGSQSQATPKEPLQIDLTSSQFLDLEVVGGWINYRDEDLLLIRISANEIRAFDNSCPHQGNRDRWSFDGSKFTCGYHNNSYSNSCSGSLTCYTTEIDGTILTVNL